MGILSIFGVKPKDKRINHTFNDSDREFSAEIRSAKRELELMKIERENELHKLKMEKTKLELQQEINELKGLNDDDFSDDSDSETTALLKMLAPMFLNKTPSSVQSPAEVSTINPPKTEQKRTINNEMLLNIWNSTPLAAKQYAKVASDEFVVKTLKKQLPDCDEDTYARALNIIRQNPV